MHADACSSTADVGTVDGIAADQRTDVVDKRVHALVEHRLLIDLHQEVHAAAQVQAEQHRTAVDGLEPAGHGRGQVQRTRVVIAKLGSHHIGGLDLGVGIGQPHQQFIAHLLDPGEAQLLFLQRALHACFQRGIDQVAAIRGDLHRRILRKRIGQCVEEAEQQHHHDQDVFPAGKLEHGGRDRIDGPTNERPRAARQRPFRWGIGW